MARIRTIKPEMWTDEKFGPLDPLTKLVFIGLISQADDAGRILDSVRLIDGLLFAYDDSTSVRRSLDELSRTGLIRRGQTSSGQQVLQIAKWGEHQKIDRPNLDAALPPITKPHNDLETLGDDSTKPRRSLDEGSSLRSTTNDLRSTTLDSGSKDPSSASTAVLEFLERTGAEWRLKDKSVREWVREIESDPRYAGADIPFEVGKAADWHVGKKKKPAQPDMSLRNWLEKAAKDAETAKGDSANGRGLNRPLQRLGAG